MVMEGWTGVYERKMRQRVTLSTQSESAASRRFVVAWSIPVSILLVRDRCCIWHMHDLPQEKEISLPLFLAFEPPTYQW